MPSSGWYGPYGGAFVPETLSPAVAELANRWQSIVDSAPFQQRYREIVSDPGYVTRVLREGAERVTPIANSTVELVKSRMGLYTES